MKKSILLALTLLLAIAARAEVKYVFYFIGDGMGMGPAMAAQMYARQVLGRGDGITMMQFPVASMAMTYSASSPVTDSAAAGTALASGKKTANGTVGLAADSTVAVSIAQELKNRGWGVGIATSVAPDDATPAAFYAHVPKRSQYYDIACQAAESGYDFLAGAGLRREKDKNGKPTDLIDRFTAAGYRIQRGAQGVESDSADKILLLNRDGVNHANNISYTIDSVADALSLPFITSSAIAHMQKVSPERFFIMIEGGNIDHALHANDGGAAIKEVLNFNDAIALAYDFYKAHPDETLIVVTADHDTGGMALGNKFRHYEADLGYIDSQRISKDKFADFCRELASDSTLTWQKMKDILSDKLGLYTAVPVSESQDKELRQLFDDTFINHTAADAKTLYAAYNAFTDGVWRIFNDIVGIGFTTTSHTGNPVPVFAIGTGAQTLSSVNNNTDIPGAILRAVDTDKQ